MFAIHNLISECRQIDRFDCGFHTNRRSAALLRQGIPHFVGVLGSHLFTSAWENVIPWAVRDLLRETRHFLRSGETPRMIAVLHDQVGLDLRAADDKGWTRW